MKRILILLGIATSLLGVRLGFFLVDGTNDTIESILIWVIFALSALICTYVILEITDFKIFIKENTNSVVVFCTIITLDILFVIVNQIPIDLVYPFSLIFTAFVISLLLSFLPRKWNSAMTYTVLTLTAIYVFGQDFFRNIFNDFFILKDFLTIREGIEFSESSYSFKFFHVLIVLIYFVSVFIVYYMKSGYNNNVVKIGWRKSLLLPVILFTLVNINATYPPKTARMYLSDHYVYTSLYSKEKFVSKFSTVNLFIRDFTGLLIPDFSYKKDVEYIEEYYEENTKLHFDNEYTGIYKDKNLIFILGESFDSLAVSEELTPNIYKLKTEGLDFINHYTPVFPRTTCDTEIIVNTSIIPSLIDGPTCYVYNDNSYNNSLANAFNLSGYNTNALHSNDKEFYTRHIVYDGLGYDSFYGQDEVDLNETTKRFDSEFFLHSKDIVVQDEKFFTMMITLSGHSPYTNTNIAVKEHYDTVDQFYGDSIPEDIKNFIASQIELDIMVGEILDDLAINGELDNTVIILTNDHYPYMIEKEIYDEYKGYDEKYQRNKGVMYIWSTDTEHAVIETLSSSFDILPTINNLFDLGMDYESYVGIDVFDDSAKSIVYFKDFAIFDGVHYIELDSTKKEFQEKIEEARLYYELCRKLLKTDFYS